MVDVEVVNRSNAKPEVEAAIALAREVLSGEGINEGELGLTFVGAEEIRSLKREYLGIDEATDALAFPIDRRDDLRGCTAPTRRCRHLPGCDPRSVARAAYSCAAAPGRLRPR